MALAIAATASPLSAGSCTKMVVRISIGYPSAHMHTNIINHTGAQ